MTKNEPKPRPDCPKCGGEGVVYFPPDPDKFPNGGIDTCPQCGGSGKA